MSEHAILITGANGGIGNATARYFLEHDESRFVYLGIRSGRGEADALVAEFPGRCGVLSLDVTDRAAWEAALDHVTGEGRIITVLVNNAGHHDDHLMATMPDDAWFSVIDSNLTSTFLGSRAVLRGMMGERFGRIVNVSSLSALLSPAGQTNYAAAKAGVIALTASLAKEVARMGITVNAVCPGYIETFATEGGSSEEKKARKNTIPMRRFGQPREVAAAVFFLAGQDAAYITGAALKIDGGII